MGRFRIHTEIKCHDDITSRINSFSKERIWIVADSFLEKSSLLNEYIQRFSSKNTVEIYTNIIPDPPLSKVIEGIKVYNTFSPTVILAIGGGSAIDTAKLIAYYAAKLEGTARPFFAAIPTTSGTGSEVTSFAVVTDTETNTKDSVVDDSISPDEAWLDERFVMSCPDKVTANSGMDALTHAIEALVANHADAFTDALSEYAVKMIFALLPKCYHKTATADEWHELLAASSMAGMAFQNAGLGISHAISHQLGAVFHIPHGLANALLLPEAIAFNMQDETACHKYADLARKLGFANFSDNNLTAAGKLLSAVKALSNEVGCSIKLKDLSISNDEIVKNLPVIVSKTMKDFTFPGNPRTVSTEDIVRIVLNISE